MLIVCVVLTWHLLPACGLRCHESFVVLSFFPFVLVYSLLSLLCTSFDDFIYVQYLAPFLSLFLSDLSSKKGSVSANLLLKEKKKT